MTQNIGHHLCMIPNRVSNHFHAKLGNFKKDSPLAPYLESLCHIRNFLHKICPDGVFLVLGEFEPRSSKLLMKQQQ